ncbi:MAG: AAA family ATPase [Thermoplasmatales archaeon]
MKISEVTVHNYRTISDGKVKLGNYTNFVGPNSAGKSNFIRSILQFYDYEGFKYNREPDFPKFDVIDSDVWVDIEYELLREEYSTLDEQYRLPGNKMKLRRKLESRPLYGYRGSELSSDAFYGYANVSKAKIGEVIYIPAVPDSQEAFKFSGPSTVRDSIEKLIGKILDESVELKVISENLKNYIASIGDKTNEDGNSLNSYISKINDNMKSMNMEFLLDTGEVKPDIIVKSLFSVRLKDTRMGREVEQDSIGTGQLRHLFYNMIRIYHEMGASRQNEETQRIKFSPRLNLLLFEEPEAYLHPPQQIALNKALKDISMKEDWQVIITSHSPVFLSKDTTDLTNIARFQRNSLGMSQIFQANSETIDDLLSGSAVLIDFLKKKSSEADISQGLKSDIDRVLAGTMPDLDNFRYQSFLDGERASAFFTDKVIICEGKSDKLFIEHIIEKNKLDDYGIYVLDSLGKYNLHRFMKLFQQFGISHIVMYDSDEHKPDKVPFALNRFIEDMKNSATVGSIVIPKDLETQLKITIPNNRDDLKPLMILKRIKEEGIDDMKDLEVLVLEQIKKLIE